MVLRKDDSGRKSNGSELFPIGLVAGLVMTLGFALARTLEMTVLNFEMALGSIVTRTTGVGTWILGFALHLVISGGIATLYGLGFQRLGRSGWKVGISFGLIHWLAIGILLGVIPEVHWFTGLAPARHPLFGGGMPDISYFGLNYGAGTFLSLLVLHLLFGAIVGELDRRVLQNRSRSESGAEARSNQAA